jgi:putative membrane protein
MESENPPSGTPQASRRHSSPSPDSSGPAAPFWTIWLVALGIVVALMAAVVRYLSLPAHETHQGHSRSATALTRLGAPETLDQLLGRSLLLRWQLDAVAIVFVTVLGAFYFTRVLRVRRTGRWPIGRTLSFAAGLAVCIIATSGSIGVYDMALFSAHMLGHLAFVMVAPALLMAGRPIELLLDSSSPQRRAWLQARLNGPVWTVLTAPPVALASYSVVIVGSHLTGLMDTIMSNPWASQVEHLVYLIFGCQFFLLVLGDTPGRWQLSTPARWLMLALSMAVDTFVGIVIMQSTQPVTMLSVPGLHVNTLSDTHTGGAIMWFGGDGIMAAIMIALVIGWLRDPVRQRRDNRGWLEQARRVTFAERTGGPAQEFTDDLDFDDEDDRLRAYNKWLAEINAEH